MTASTSGVPETLADGHVWLRIADPAWANPLDPSFAANYGGRWNAPASHPTLYLNEDLVTARLNLRGWAGDWPWEPEDLRPEHAPVLIQARLPRDQIVADAHTPAGIRQLGLPATYPLTKSGQTVPHSTCQPIGQAVRAAGLRGLRCRSAQTPAGAGRELAWFPATLRSVARIVGRRSFDDWYWD